MTDVVILDELATASGHGFGLATLNAPASLNSLSLAMVQGLTPALGKWADDDRIAGVVLQGSGDKAFCAGGDLRELYRSLKASGSQPSAYARDFFSQEYALDYLIHHYPKPILCWGTGFVMGGGIGLMAGAAHRVVTETSRLAMPEITVGLYPDVGASWFLRRMPGLVGLFIALTGAPLNAADALFSGLADIAVDSEHRADVLADIGNEHWNASANDNRKTLSRLLARYTAANLAESPLRKHLDVIDGLMAGDNLHAIDARLRQAHTDDAWLANAIATYAKGSPSSAALSFELRKRSEHLSLADVLRLEYDVSLGCCAHFDFPEGVRALLIDKDKNPGWNPASLAGVTPDLIEDHFRRRFAGEHPLAKLHPTFRP